MSETYQQPELELWGAPAPGEDSVPAVETQPMFEGVFTAPLNPTPYTLPPRFMVARSAQEGRRPTRWEEYDLMRWSTSGYTEPELVRSVWRTVEELGFEGGRVLEPGAGGGAFTAMAPAGAEMTRVEMSAENARRAEELYPDADVRWEAFPRSEFPDGHFDAVVGNIPTSTLQPYVLGQDRRQWINDQFIIKSLSLTRPGGIVAVVTGFGTLDDPDPRARREMSEMADLLGAVRLPDGLQYRTNRMDSSGDVLVFRRREPGVEPASRTWEKTSRRTEPDGQTVDINDYFSERPEHVLGDLSVARSRYGLPVIQVEGDVPAAPRQLREVLSGIAKEAGGSTRIEEPSVLWDSYRAALISLGDARAAQLFKSVTTAREGLPGVDERTLRSARQAAATALSRLDTDAARTTRELERVQRTALGKRRLAERAALNMELAVARTTGRDREEAAEDLARRRADVEGHNGRIAEAEADLAKLRTGGRDPDRWLRGAGKSVVACLAAEGVQARERLVSAATNERAAGPPGGAELAM